MCLSLLSDVLDVLACSARLRAHVWRVCLLSVLGILVCLTCLLAGVFDVVLCLRAYVLAMMKCFTFLRACVPGVLSIGVLTFLSAYSFCLHKSTLCN